MRLEHFLAELLYEHDCVIIPGFGGLVANFRSAKLYPRTHYIVPPAKHIGFNRNLLQNDGLLANHISNVTGMGYPDATSFIKKCVEDFKQELSDGKRIIWENIGFLFLDKSGNLQFVPNDNENYLISSYGLKPLQLKPVAVRQAPDVIETREIVLPAARQSAKTWMTAAAIALPLVIASAFLLRDQLDGGEQFGFNGWNPFKSKTVISDFHPRNPDPVKNESTTGFESLPADSSGSVTYNFVEERQDANGIRVIVRPEVKTEISAPPVVKNTPEDFSAGKYAVVAGAFKIEENADKLVRQLQEKGFNAHRIGKSKGLFLVAFSEYATIEEAKEAMKSIRQKENMKAWVKKK